MNKHIKVIKRGNQLKFTGLKNSLYGNKFSYYTNIWGKNLDK